MARLAVRHARRSCASLAALAWCLQFGAAHAFPLATEDNPSFIPLGADLTQPDAQQLQHQMGLATGFASLGSQQGWTILPRLSMDEEFTDNVEEVHSPRRWDISTIVAPGVSVLGNSDLAQLRLDYEPQLEMHARSGDQNVLVQQLNAVGTLTIIPDLFFIDVRGLAGSQAVNGGVGGLGGLGQTGIGGITGTTAASVIGQTGTAGLSKQNRSVTTSGSVSPYLLDQFGDFGTARVGISLTRSTSAPVTGFAPIPFASSGTSSQSLTTIQETASFQSGPEFEQLRDSLTATGEQGEGSGIGSRSTQRDTASNRVDYQFTQAIDVYGSIGWEVIDYSGGNTLNVSDLTWSVGTVLTPDPDTSVTIGYGHQNDTNSVTFSGRYALTPRTFLTGSYDNGIGTQLEQVANQLNQASVANNGTLVNSQTGGQLFTANNALGVSTGIFRFTNLTFGLSTVLDRDTINLSVTHSHETRVGAGAGATSTSNEVTVGTASWVHELSPDVTLSGTVSYSLGNPAAGFSSNSLSAALALQYIVTDTLSLFARANAYDVQASTAAQSWYQDVLLVGFTKQF